MMTIEDERSQIEKLPKKVMTQILTFLHPKQLRICASLNRFFYKQVVSMETTACIVLRTNADLQNVAEVYQTSRIIHSIRVGCEESKTIVCIENCWNALFAIFIRHGPNLRNISLVNMRIAREDLNFLIGCCGQYVSLELLQIDSNIQAQNDKKYGHVNQRSKEVTVKYCDENIQKIILNLAPHTVTSIDFLCGTNAHLLTFFMRQKNLKKISVRLYNDYINLSCLQLKTIESMSFGSYSHQSSLVNLLLTQANNLQYLDLSCAIINNYVFSTISFIVGLRTLKVSVNDVALSAFWSIKKLTQLEELTLIKNDLKPEVHLSALAECTNTKLRKLELLYPITDIKTSVYNAVVSTFRLQDFYINSIFSLQSMQGIINHSRNSLRTLKIQDSHRLMMSMSEIVKGNSLFTVNLNLRELTLNFDADFIGVAVRVFPKLQKLEFETSGNTSELLEIIFTELKDLTELRVHNKCAVSVVGLCVCNLLLRHGSRFKYISMCTLMVHQTYLDRVYGRTFVEIKQDSFTTEFYN